MTSDSDIDEDELLQMALKEQSERDINYHKQSKPSKPVVNLIQAPPPPPFMRTNNSNPMPNARSRSNSKGNHRKSKGGADDDDDSEVELLSISSGDEESSRDLGVTQKVRPQRRGSIDDDRADDGCEPRSWKRVDESELARRVRELRETRSTPQAIDAKPLGRKGLANLQSLPHGVEFLDPLGLGVIDNKSLRLITDVLEEKPETVDPNNREKVMYTSPDFHPKLFLTRVHQETSAADLESGALTLKSHLKGWTQQKKQLVKENFDCFVSCKTTIDDIESKLRQIEEDPEGSGTAHLYESTHRISELANRSFQPLFERQVQAEKIRSVQGMLQRFRTLFNLPSIIRGCISKGEYDLAVREYRKAKSIVLPSHVGILKRVLEEVEKVMREFKSMLYKSMEDPQLDLAELENTVRLLIELEPDSDPVWHYLSIQNHRVRGLFEKCTIDYEAQMELLHNEIQERAQSDARWRQIQQDSNKSLGVDSSEWDSLAVDSQQLYMTGEEVDALRGRYISRLTAVLIHHIPAFWRLALSVFSGKFAKGTAGNVHLDSDVNAKHVQSRTEEKATDVKFSSHSLEEVTTMVHDTVNAFEVKVHTTFREFEESNILRPYMSDAIKEIAKACQALEGKEFSPSVAVKTLRALHFEITKVHVFRLCSWMRVASEEIAKEEMWIPLSTLERNKSPYAISYLPIAFREMMSSAMDRIQAMIHNLTTEATKSDDMLDHIQEIQDSVRIGFLNCFLDFAGYLERIGAEVSQANSNKEDGHLQNGFLYGFDGELHGFASGGAVVDSHKRLLIVLSNIGYCKDELARGLYKKYMHIWMSYRERTEQNTDVRDLVSSFSALEEKVLENYTYAKLTDYWEMGVAHLTSKDSPLVKSNLIRNAALNYLLDSGIQWGSAPAVKGIRDATIDLIHSLVAVHAEVFSGSRPLLEKTMGILVEGLIDTFLSLSHENKTKHKAKYMKSLDVNGFCQFMLELEYIETVLHSYFSPAALESLKSLQGLLLEKTCEGASESAENPGHHRRPTKGSEDAITEDRQQGSNISPDDLIALAQQYSIELLEGELERTRLNISCFMEASLHPTSVPAAQKPSYSSFQKTVSSPHYKRQQTVNSPSFSRHRRR